MIEMLFNQPRWRSAVVRGKVVETAASDGNVENQIRKGTILKMIFYIPTAAWKTLIMLHCILSFPQFPQPLLLLYIHKGDKERSGDKIETGLAWTRSTRQRKKNQFRRRFNGRF